MKHLELLERANDEIKQLRHQNQLQAARLEVFDSMMLLFTSLPNYQARGLMHPDIVYEITKAIEAEKNNTVPCAQDPIRKDD